MLRYVTWIVALWQLRGDPRMRSAPSVLDRLTWRERATFISTLARDPRLPKRARFAALLIAAYVAMPIDFTPDFIPFVGQLDDALFVTMNVRMAQRSLPPGLIQDHARRAAHGRRPKD